MNKGKKRSPRRTSAETPIHAAHQQQWACINYGVVVVVERTRRECVDAARRFYGVHFDRYRKIKCIDFRRITISEVEK